jgi:spermidine synthase
MANAALAALLWLARPGERATFVPAWRWTAVLLPLPLAAGILLLPPDRVILAAGTFRHDRPGDLVHFAEDASASVTIRRARSPAGRYLSLELNGVNVAGTSPELYAVQKMQGHLPLLLAADARRVLHIGFGSGGTAHAVSLHPVERIKIVEISPAVLDASDRWFADLNFGVLRDPRVEAEINDGRNYLLATRERFDAILSDSIHPRYAGNGSLYSREYFRLVGERLAPGGVASMWLPMYSMRPDNYAMVLRAFAEVFPHVAVWYEPSSINSFTIVTGTADRPAWDSVTLARAFGAPAVRRELAELGIHGPAELLACYLDGGEALRRRLERVPPHVDDLPAVEYESGALLERDWTWLAIFADLVRRRPPSPPAEFLAALSPAERARAERLFAERRALLASHQAALERGLRQRSAGGAQSGAAGTP